MIILWSIHSLRIGTKVEKEIHSNEAKERNKTTAQPSRMSLIPCSSITFLFALSRIVITGFTNNTPQFDQRTVKIDSYSVLFRRISAKCRLLHFIYIKRYNNINSFLFFSIYSSLFSGLNLQNHHLHIDRRRAIYRFNTRDTPNKNLLYAEKSVYTGRVKTNWEKKPTHFFTLQRRSLHWTQLQSSIAR